MFKNVEDEKLATLVMQGIAAGCALIGLMVDSDNMNTDEKNVEAAWKLGDLMAAEFIRRGKAAEEK